MGFLGGTAVRNRPAVRETRVLSLGAEGSPEEETAACSRMLVWESPWAEGPGRLPAPGVGESRTQLTAERTSAHAAVHKRGHGF